MAKKFIGDANCNSIDDLIRDLERATNLLKKWRDKDVVLENYDGDDYYHLSTTNKELANREGFSEADED